MTDQVNLANVHVQFNRLIVALDHAAQATNDPVLKRWAEEMDAEHHTFYDETHHHRNERFVWKRDPENSERAYLFNAYTGEPHHDREFVRHVDIVCDRRLDKMGQ